MEMLENYPGAWGSMMVRTGIITGYGINADEELAEAFAICGAAVNSFHINDLIEDPSFLEDLHILGFPGGFSFGDHIGSGLVFAHVCKKHLRPSLERFIHAGKLIIGICNGFQILVKMGVLPNFSGGWTQEVSLIHNENGMFHDGWVRVTVNQEGRCIWTKGLSSMDLPIRHGEGRFYAENQALYRLADENLITLTYDGENPNGSLMNIAGITDMTGRVFGLMPHPEAYLVPENHPYWTRKRPVTAEGVRIFQNGVEYIRTRYL